MFRIDIVSYFAVLTLLFYILIGAFPPEPDHDFVSYDLPAMIYVLLLIMVIGWILPWLSFLFDRHRVLPEIPVVLLIVIFYNVFRTDHYYDVVYADDACPEQEAATEQLAPVDQALARKEWAGSGTTRPVIVAASGGGISAAYWTAIVLSEIEAGLRFDGAGGAGFSDTVHMVSGTSGGSVGLLYYVDAFSAKQAGARQFTTQELDWIREAAGASSLNAVGWGLVFRDFWRLVFPPLAAREKDRGTAMEARWVQGLLANRKRHAASGQGTGTAHNPTIGDWVEGARQGWQPAVAFNSVLVETGELFQLANVDLPPLRKDTATTRDTEHQFQELFPGADIAAVTAARLSATFPWVTPSARPDLPDGCKNLYHAADGGYYDNYGVISALAYNKALRQTEQYRPVLIEIRSSDSRLRAEPELDGGFGMVVLGPIQTLLSVRSTSQLGRNEGLAEAAFSDADRIIFELRKKAPLSWHLAPRERADIAAEWREPHNREAFEKLCKALNARCDLPQTLKP